jgi:acetolactate synthase-1/2/3 large subunit
MAEAYGKLTGRPGVLFVSRGPGATNASIGVHTAFQDSTPLVVFIGQVGTDEIDREAFQEIDYRRMYGPLAKWVAQVDRAERIPELVSHAFHLAMSGRCGPVVLALPEDMLETRAPAQPLAPYQRIQASPSDDDLQRVRAMLAQARRPMVLLGGSGWTAEACADIRAFAEASDLPVACTYRCQDLFDNRHPNYVGDVSVGLNPALERRIREADLLLVVGARMGGWTTVNFTLLEIPKPRQKFIHVHAGAEQLGSVYQGDLLINSGMPEFAGALRTLEPVHGEWDAHTRAAREDYLQWQRPVTVAGTLNPSQIVHFLRRRLPPETIVACGAGVYIVWMHRFFQYTGLRTQLGPTSGCMGYGVPAAIAAKLVCPERPVISFNGDGCFLMNGQELATARRYGAKLVHIILNNGIYGTIRMNQEQRYPGRVIGTELSNPDFVMLARSYGLHAERVAKTEEFESAFERAWKAEHGALIELELDPDVISPRTTLTRIRAAEH